MSKQDSKLVSIIIRTKNEEKWISACLSKVFDQTYKNIEVILVDNNSTDNTVDKAKLFPVKVFHYKDKAFLPGKAINLGIRVSNGYYIVCLSGHCIPTNKYWLENLITNLKDKNVAGVYGRQEPLSYTNDLDKRDLLTVFGLDKKIQLKDSFFHNANSCFRKDFWNEFQFDEDVTNIEDRVWGAEVIKAGFKIIYEPNSSVYHWHGINHALDPKRAKNIVQILESLNPKKISEKSFPPEDLEITAIIPIKGLSRDIGGEKLLKYTIDSALESKFINNIVVSTDSQETADFAKSQGVMAPFLRPQELSMEYVAITDVLMYTLKQIECLNIKSDLIVLLEETYPFREKNLVDNMISQLLQKGFETIVAGRPEKAGIWVHPKNEEISLINDGIMPTSFKESNATVSLMGLTSVTHPSCIREGDLLSGHYGIFPVKNTLSSFQIKSETSEKLTIDLIKVWKNNR